MTSAIRACGNTWCGSTARLRGRGGPYDSYRAKTDRRSLNRFYKTVLGRIKKRPAEAGRLGGGSVAKLRAGAQRQPIRAQNRIDRRVVAIAATVIALATLAATATPRQHALRLPSAGDERTTRIAALGASSGASQPSHRAIGIVVVVHIRNGDVLAADRTAMPAAGAARAAQRGADGGFGAAAHGDVAVAVAVDARRQGVGAVDFHPAAVGAAVGAAGHGRGGEGADADADVPLAHFLIDDFADGAAVAGGGVARGAALGDGEADRAGVQVAVARVAQHAAAALDGDAALRAVFHGFEAHGAGVQAAARGEVDAGVFRARGDADHHGVAGQVDRPAVHALRRFAVARQLAVELALGAVERGQAVAHAAGFYARHGFGGGVVDRGAGGDQGEGAVALALQPGAGEVAAEFALQGLRLRRGDAFELEVLAELGVAQAQVALHGRLQGGGEVVGGQGRAGHHQGCGGSENRRAELAHIRKLLKQG